MKFQKARVAKIEPKLRSGDIIGVISRERNGLHSTAHVGLALRTSDGVLHFMHASSPSNYGKGCRRRSALEIPVSLPFGQRNSGRPTFALRFVELVQFAEQLF
jgi:hypothetical protein